MRAPYPHRSYRCTPRVWRPLGVSQHVLLLFSLPHNCGATAGGGSTGEELWNAAVNQLDATYVGQHCATYHKRGEWLHQYSVGMAGQPHCDGEVPVHLLGQHRGYMLTEQTFPHSSSNYQCALSMSSTAGCLHQLFDVRRNTTSKASFVGVCGGCVDSVCKY